jgi:hypothetical protein
MPTLLWRVLNSIGYPEGKEPRYYWNRDQLGDGTLVYVEVIVLARGEDPNWGGWSFGSKRKTPEEGASRAAFVVLRDIMERFPEELASAVAGVFPRGDPYTTMWDQPEGKALEGGHGECRHSDNATMSAMFTMMKTYASLERSFGCLASSLGQALDKKHQVQHDHSNEMERLQAKLAQMTLKRDQAIHRDEVAM